MGLTSYDPGMNKIEHRSWFADSVRRYLPAEAAGTAASVATGLLLLGVGWASGAAALAAAWAESAGYYGVIGFRDLRTPGAPYRLRTATRLLVEFGPAELADSVFVRPALVYAGLRLLPSPAAGLLAGKVAADLLFYLPTITSRRLLLRQMNTNGRNQ